MLLKLLGTALALVALASALVVVGILGNRPPLTEPPGPAARIARYLTRNVAETGPGASLPELAPVYLRGAPRALLPEVAAACRGLGWREVRVDPHGTTVRAEVVSKLFRFVDDVEIRLVARGEGTAEARVRSAARVGRGDLGANARHVMDLRAALDRRDLLASAAP